MFNIEVNDYLYCSLMLFGVWHFADFPPSPSLKEIIWK